MVFKTTTNIDGDSIQYTTLDFQIYDNFYNVLLILIKINQICDNNTYTITFAEVIKLRPRYSYFPPDFPILSAL